jgi:hypothetical protein
MKKQKLQHLELRKKSIAEMNDKKTAQQLLGGANTFRFPCIHSIFHHCT